MVLLRREQARLASRAASAEEARRTALEARTRLVGENVELLIGDVEDGLLDALGQVPQGELANFLDHWQATQPLVRVAFLAEADGHLLRPNANATNDEARGFFRRFANSFATSAPWVDTRMQQAFAPPQQALAPPPASSKTKDLDRAEAAANQVQLNTVNLQRARREAKNLSKASSPSSFFNSRSDTSDTAGSASKESPRPLQQQVVVPERRGWTARINNGRLHVLGWVQPGGSNEVRGAELELTALVSRLGSALPVEVGPQEGFALRDDRQRVLHQVGWVPRATQEPTSRVQLNDTSFPGWEVVGYLEPAAYDSSGSGGFFLVGALLVGIFVVAILSGGSLLLWQARRSEAEAQQKTSFVANVSHEFKTPLTSIRLYSELLEQGRVKDDEKRSEYLRTISRETQRLARLVNNALDFSRLEQGRKKYQLETVDLRAELIRIVDTQRPRLAELPLAVNTDFPTDPLEIRADRDAFEQIVLNLLDNACKYAASGGTLALQLRRAAPQGAELRVADRGPGVPLEHRERIFEKFHRVDETLTAEKTGAGLGLSIARQLARGLGGDLCYEPGEGGGAVFVLRLP